MSTLFDDEFTVSASVTFTKNENGSSVKDIEIKNREYMWNLVYVLISQAKTNMSNKEIVFTIIDLAKGFGKGTLETLLKEIVEQSDEINA